MFQNKKSNEENHIDEENTPIKIKTSIKINFPWLSVFSALILISYLMIMTNEEVRFFYQLPEQLFNHQIKLITFIMVGCLLLIDARLFYKRKNRTMIQINQLKSQLDFTLKSKKQQQKKANIYSEHTEKLKLFISDKLLEYIEYDEKFLHFKGIASEVRHNGVISYDKVMTALKVAIEQQNFLALYEQNDKSESTSSTHTVNSLSNYQNAIDAMRYLWDLLDLSTADNMSLHIGNQLIECEENYYQLHLNSEKAFDITQSIPISPTFHPQIAVLMTVSMLSNEKEIKDLISLAKINNTVLEESFLFKNEQFKIKLKNTPELLGNPNHIILLLENLIKNAQFFNHKVEYKQKTDRIVLTLTPGNGFAHFVVYNRGPHITEEEKKQIFKLGFSTRKNKQHHGKGLGLFFSHEIIKGYQGHIKVKNIITSAAQYALTLILASGDFIVHDIECDLIDDRIVCKLLNTNTWQKEIKINSDIPITSIEVTQKNENNLHFSQTFNEYKIFEWLDPNNSFQPQWIIKLNAFKKTHKLIFKPLDINGVQFDIKIPTAISRLDEQELDFEENDNIENSLNKLNEAYQSLS